jgi:hypothetical protein
LVEILLKDSRKSAAENFQSENLAMIRTSSNRAPAPSAALAASIPAVSAPNPHSMTFGSTTTTSGSGNEFVDSDPTIDPLIQDELEINRMQDRLRQDPTSSQSAAAGTCCQSQSILVHAFCFHVFERKRREENTSCSF